MLDSAADRIAALPQNAVVLDVGGWAAPLARADWVIDLLPYESRGLYGAPVDPDRERFSQRTWVQRDICASESWPFAQDQFDFVVCSHTLEDVRDPIRVCQEIVRVGRAGYVEVPAPIEDLTYGIHGPWVGWSHHHWISEHEDGGLRFTMKPHLLAAPDRHLPEGSCEGLAAEQLTIQLWWEGGFTFREQILVGAPDFDRWLEQLLLQSRDLANPAPASRFRRGRRRPPF